MPRKIIPRTAVAPDGGIYRVKPLPAIKFSFEEQKSTPISRWLESWGPHILPEHIKKS